MRLACQYSLEGVGTFWLDVRPETKVSVEMVGRPQAQLDAATYALGLLGWTRREPVPIVNDEGVVLDVVFPPEWSLEDKMYWDWSARD